MGLENRLVQQGIVFQVEEPSPSAERVDVDATIHNLEQVYLYRGLLKADGTFDQGVYKDDNAMRLVQNYGAAYIEAARECLNRNEPDKAGPLLAKAAALSPESPAILYSIALLKMDMGQWKEAEDVLQGLVRRGARDYRLYRLLGETQEAQGHNDEAERSYRTALQLGPDSFDPVRDLFGFYWQVKRDPDAALGVIDEWLERHPNDQKVRRARQVYADSAASLRARH
jgi:tetratricopeptide (TPR) repeat protein